MYKNDSKLSIWTAHERRRHSVHKNHRWIAIYAAWPRAIPEKHDINMSRVIESIG